MLAKWELIREKNYYVLKLYGNWTTKAISRSYPLHVKLPPDLSPGCKIIVDMTQVEEADSLLPAILLRLIRECKERSIVVDLSALPKEIQKLLETISFVHPSEEQTDQKTSITFYGWLQLILEHLVYQIISVIKFIGEIFTAFIKWLGGKAMLRKEDLFKLIEQTGVKALALVLLINLLVGMILAFVGVVQLQQFGAAIYVANLVALAMLREMGPLMTAIILSGRTGAAYAAELGTMQVSQEMEALKVIGVSPIEFLILPRLIALTLMMPFLVIFGIAIGLAGGALVTTSMLDISLRAYWHQTILLVSLRHLNIGLIKAPIFGAIVAFWGCYYGMNCGKSAEAVGKATTLAVVASITSLIVADAIFAIILSKLQL